MAPSPLKTTSEISVSPLPPSEDASTSCLDHFKVFRPTHMKALIWKNFLWMWRNPGVMAFIIGLPCLQIVLFCYAIGHNPVGLRLAVTNHELIASEYDSCPKIEGCNYTLFSCRYLDLLKEKKMEIVSALRTSSGDFKSNRDHFQGFYNTEEESYEEVRRGRAWGSLIFKSNYTTSLVDRTENGRYAEDATIEASDVDIRMDMSSKFSAPRKEFRVSPDDSPFQINRSVSCSTAISSSATSTSSRTSSRRAA